MHERAGSNPVDPTNIRNIATIMEEIRKKANEDELNKKAVEDISKPPRRYIPVPRPARCIECGRLFDLNEGGWGATSNGYLCKDCNK